MCQNQGMIFSHLLRVVFSSLLLLCIFFLNLDRHNYFSLIHSSFIPYLTIPWHCFGFSYTRTILQYVWKKECVTGSHLIIRIPTISAFFLLSAFTHKKKTTRKLLLFPLRQFDGKLVSISIWSKNMVCNKFSKRVHKLWR